MQRHLSLFSAAGCVLSVDQNDLHRLQFVTSSLFDQILSNDKPNLTNQIYRNTQEYNEYQKVNCYTDTFNDSY